MKPVVETDLVVEPVGLRIHEMHLADQTGRIARACEIMRYRPMLHRHRYGVVQRLVIVRVKPGQQRRPRRRADRIAAIGVRESNAALGQRVQIGSPGHRVSRGAEAIPLVLIRHDDQYILSLEELPLTQVAGCPSYKSCRGQP